MRYEHSDIDPVNKTSSASALDPWDLTPAEVDVVEQVLDPNSPIGKAAYPPCDLERIDPESLKV